MKEKITVGLFAEWDEEKGGWYVSTNCDFYRDGYVLHLREGLLVETCDEWVPAFALLKLVGLNAEEAIDGKVLKEIESVRNEYKLK
mgnify:CR=1 FL=1